MEYWHFPNGTESVLGRVLTMWIRAEMAARRMSGRDLAGYIGVSQGYLAKRLRDAAPLTLDDFAAIVEVFDDNKFSLDAFKAITDAWNRYAAEVADDQRNAHLLAELAEDEQRNAEKPDPAKSKNPTDEKAGRNRG